MTFSKVILFSQSEIILFHSLLFKSSPSTVSGMWESRSLFSIECERWKYILELFFPVISESGSDQCLWAVSHHAASIQCHAIECHNVTLFSSLTPTPALGLYLIERSYSSLYSKRFESLFSAERHQLLRPFCSSSRTLKERLCKKQSSFQSPVGWNWDPATFQSFHHFHNFPIISTHIMQYYLFQVLFD